MVFRNKVLELDLLIFIEVPLVPSVNRAIPRAGGAHMHTHTHTHRKGRVNFRKAELQTKS